MRYFTSQLSNSTSSSYSNATKHSSWRIRIFSTGLPSLPLLSSIFTPEAVAVLIISLTPEIKASTLSLLAGAAAGAALWPISSVSPLVAPTSLVTDSISFSKTPLEFLIASSTPLVSAFFVSDILPESSFNLFLVFSNPFFTLSRCFPTALLLSPNFTTVRPKASPRAFPKEPKIS
ncbi:hypothetical protein BCO_0900070 (plasmid) [Borrelia coriaceae ATCC 43381]|uniref:Uncharacterized protein n=1 Tax=Borrelia coriaceae ATCC 43381 TaxID=1408429 RepID=W5SVN8_9SPIR|nr:hypothetical protein BCO_0900070 [Borrelia coriaceae ATCC 43381]